MGKVLILGSSGMVGHAVAARLRELSVPFLGANRSGEGGAMVIDAADPPPLESLVAGADVVVNALGVLREDRGHPDDSYALRAARVNAVFPLLVAQAAHRQGCRVIHLSTDAVFAPADSPADESTNVSPTDPYGLTKALGEARAAEILNIRCSVVGPAAGRAGGLWEWFVTQPRQARVHGFLTRWTGVTSRQVAVLCSDLVDRAVFEQVRSLGHAHHFVPNEPITKFDLLCMLRDSLRPDVEVVEDSSGPGGRELISSTGALDAVFSGPRGWQAGLADAVAAE